MNLIISVNKYIKQSFNDSDTPSTIIIVPYRNREIHKILFEEAMKNNLSQLKSYKIYYAHQNDLRPFNRGAMKNLGFLAIKKLFPKHYRNITFVFHDIDCWHTNPNAIDYKTEKGTVKHYYGYKFALGGIFAIKGCDFEKICGFPNFWGWGMEDNVIYERCIKTGIIVDRSIFYDITDRNMSRPFDGFKRIYNKRDVVIYKHKMSGNINNLYNCEWTIDDNMINITSFLCESNLENQIFTEFDIRQGNKLPVSKDIDMRQMKLIFYN